MTPLRAKMIDEMKLNRFSLKTQKAYVAAVAGFSRFYNQSPTDMDEEKISSYSLYLSDDRKLSWSSCNGAISGLRFFYIHGLKHDAITLVMPLRKKQKTLPEILTNEELVRLFQHADSPKKRVLLMTTYAAGLRVSEVVRLKTTDIDSGRMTIRVEQGKGNKDRYTLLSDHLLKELRLYWKLYHSKEWLFPSWDKSRPLSIATAQKTYTATKKKAGITKGSGIHTLRHCFATHLLDEGVDPRTIQVLMGHRSITTTMTYMRVTNKRLASIKSPLDFLDFPHT
jgi:integrase/recombinase XerD